MNKIFSLSICLFTASLVYTQDTLRVPMDYPSIQMALDSAADNTTILIAPDTYYENINWPDDTKGIRLIGEMGSSETIIDGGANGRVLSKDQYSDPGSLISGLTIKNGKSGNGAGLYVDGRGTELHDLYISGNESTGQTHCQGGGVRLESYSGIISDCTIIGNKGKGNWTCGGGGISISLSGSLEMRNVDIKGNTSQGGNSGSSAGLQLIGFSNSINLTNIAVSGNRTIHNLYGLTPGASISGGTIVIDSSRFDSNSVGSATISNGGGLSISGNDVLINRSFFRGNSVKDGGGIRIFGDDNFVKITNCNIFNNNCESAVFLACESSEIEIENTLITRNNGYAIHAETAFGDSPNVIYANHLTLAQNDKGCFFSRNYMFINNSIMWNYIDDTESEITKLAGAGVFAKSCIIQNGFEGSLIIDQDPLFTDSNYELRYGSPATDFANPYLSVLNSYLDVPRPSPANTLPDIGAIEVNQSQSYVDVRFFFDENQNGLKDQDDYNLTIGGVKLNDVHFPNFKEEGIDFHTPFGEHQFSYTDPAHPNWILTTDSIVIEEVIDTMHYNEIGFGLSPISNDVDLATVVEMENFRCDEYIRGSLSVASANTIESNQQLWLQIDDRINTIDFDIQPDIIINDHLVAWTMDSLKPTLDQSFTFGLFVPAVNGPEDLGQLYEFKSWVEGYEEISSFVYTPELRCSYDPNDKDVYPKLVDSLDLKRTKFYYKIRFQNNGNDYAKDVVIVDTLSHLLIPETFELINSSHPDHLIITREEDNIIRFHFKDIFLIDSLSSPELSQGFVSFLVSPIDEIAKSTEINNTASIIFDSNPPIVTNTTTTRVKDPVSAVIETWINPRNIFPNPTGGIIEFTSVPERIEIYDLEGRLIHRQTGEKSIQLNQLDNGSYIIHMITGMDRQTEVILKQ